MNNARVTVTRTSSGYRSLRHASSGGSQSDPDLSDHTSHHASVTPYLLLFLFTASLGPFQFGYHLGELNAPEAVMTCRTKDTATSTPISSTLPTCIPMDAGQWGLIQSAFTLGGLFGALGSGALAARYGRRPAIIALNFSLALGSAVESMAFSIFTLSLGRAVSGIGAGAATVVCSLYISELSPPHKRGFFGAFSQVMINAGILVAQSMGYFLSRGGLWRLIMALPCACSILALLVLFFAPETPSWLAENGDIPAAKAALRRIRRRSVDLTPEIRAWAYPHPEDEPLLVQHQKLSSEKRARPSGLQVILEPQYRKAVVATTLAFAAQQLLGINAVVMYSVSILSTILPSMAGLISVTVSGINLTVSLVCTPLPDIIGRRMCLLISIAGMGVSSAVLALGLSMDLPSMTIMSLLTFVASFGIGLGPVPFILLGEVADPEAVSAVSSWALAGSWLSAFSVAQFFPMLNRAIPDGQVFWLFSALAVVFGVLIAWRVPETKGRAGLEES
jgi:sugar porter (SP) family MFS transporter